jgi:hypothetical protein
VLVICETASKLEMHDLITMLFTGAENTNKYNDSHILFSFKNIENILLEQLLFRWNISIFLENIFWT